MTTTKKIKDEAKRGEGAVKNLEEIIKRKRLLARVAGHAASSLLVSPSPEVNSAEKIADVAVEVAEAILKRAGL